MDTGPKQVYVVMRNSEMTEGRGPMVFHSLWSTKEVADHFIDEQPGVMGRKQKWSQQKYGDWTVTPMPVYEFLEEYETEKKLEIREQALKKLSHAEKVALGLNF